MEKLPLQDPSKKALRVLIVEDETGLRDMLRYSLQKRGFYVAGVPGGPEAFALLAEQSFDVAVCDIMMPGMGGVEVLKRLKKDHPDLEVIMATGYATLETAIETMKNGAFDYITKPYSLSHLCMLFEKADEHRKLKAKVGYLEELNRLKSEFMATMSHELRTPLASMLGYVSLLQRGVYGGVPKPQNEILNRIDVNAKNLLQLINNILDLSKLSAHRMTLNPEDFNLQDLFHEISEAMEPLAGAKKLVLTLDLPEALAVHLDRTKVKQVLINLIGNAVKFTKTGSVTVTAQTAGSTLDIAVRDTGIGIEKDSIALLFREFSQLDGSTTREYSGTGLGLSISMKMSELMGGTIRVESAAGQGSTFTMSIPRIDPSKKEPISLSAIAPAGPQEKIILSIDDDPDVLKVVGDSLQGAGYRFIGALSGEEGIALARQIRPEMITLDIMMPHMDGWSVLKVLKEDPILKDVPVYIVSIIDDKALGYSLGVTDYIVKPFTQDELLQKLNLVPKSRSQQILVVDPDKESNQNLSDFLVKEGYDVESCTTGEETLARIKQVKPDAIFLNLVLPEMSGLDVMEAIAKQVQKPPAIFVMSDREVSPDQERYLSGRVKMILKKNQIPFKELVTMLRKNQSSPSKAA